jgi:uncharacterized OB-fold protein
LSRTEKPFRLLPALTPENEHFWTGGRDGELRFLHCAACDTFVHPPAPRCPECLGDALAVRAVSGRAHLHTFTENHQPWIPGFDPPYLIAIVTIDEQPTLRLTTNLVNCTAADAHIGMPLRVVFEEREDGIFLPLFEPDPEREGERAPVR